MFLKILMPISLLIILTFTCHLFCKETTLKRNIITFFICCLWISSTPTFSFLIAHAWESQTAPLLKITPSAQAMVILGGGLSISGDEYEGKPIVNNATLSRLHYGTFLYKKHSVPVLLTGGDPKGIGLSEATEMQNVLEKYYGIPTNWTETTSKNTFFNAKNTANLLLSKNIKSIYLVTHAWHMPRAAFLFRTFGFTVIEAPTEFTEKIDFSLIDFFPTSDSVLKTSLIVKEILGYIYYSVLG